MVQPIVHTLTIGEYDINAYLVICPKTHESVLIDPAGNPTRLAAWTKENQAKVKYILLTHGHPDHTTGTDKLSKLLDAPIAMHKADQEFFQSPKGRKSATRELGLKPPKPADLELSHADTLEVGELKVQIIHTPGHTPGSVCYLVKDQLFTGDTLFVGAVGRTDLSGASMDTLLHSIEHQLLPLPAGTVIYPGHDYGETPTSTLGRERLENPFITDFILDG